MTDEPRMAPPAGAFDAFGPLDEREMRAAILRELRTIRAVMVFFCVLAVVGLVIGGLLVLQTLDDPTGF